MTFRLLFITILGLTFCSCKTKTSKRIIIDDLIAEGNISKDTIYNGLIKFYDTATNKLITTANYNGGVLDGERIVYYPTGKYKAKENYENGKVNGQSTIFDSLGNISITETFYYDLHVGPSIEYKNGKVTSYGFYSFENKELLHIDYDSVKGKKIEQLNDKRFFFYHYNNYTDIISSKPQTELFIYLPKPPGFNFQYSLCIVNNKFIIRQTIKEFKHDKSWEEINLDYSMLKADESFAVKLTVDNEFDNDDKIATMFKRL